MAIHKCIPGRSGCNASGCGNVYCGGGGSNSLGRGGSYNSFRRVIVKCMMCVDGGGGGGGGGGGFGGCVRQELPQPILTPPQGWQM